MFLQSRHAEAIAGRAPAECSRHTAVQPVPSAYLPNRRRGAAHVRRLVALIVTGLLLTAAVGGAGPAAAQAITSPGVLTALAQPAAFVPLTAQRVYEGDTGVGLESVLGPGYLSVPIGGAVPSGATAVAVNITTFSQFPTQVSVCGTRSTALPWYCNAPVSSPYPDYPFSFAVGSRAVSLMATVALGPDRTLTVEGLWAPGRVAIDLLGYYAPAGATPAAGRYRPQVPQRVLDTRDGVAMVEDRSITVPLGATVPADTSAVMATVTVVDAERDTYVTAYPSGAPAPFASNLLVLNPARTLSNQIVVPVSGGQFDLRVSGRAHVLVDVVGSFTSSASSAGSDGLYVPTATSSLPLPPRADPNTDPSAFTLQPEDARTVPFTAPVFGPAVGALSLWLDARPYRPGFITVWAAGARPWTTTLFSELSSGGVAATTGVSGGSFQLISSERAEVLITVLGYYTA